MHSLPTLFLAAIPECTTGARRDCTVPYCPHGDGVAHCCARCNGVLPLRARLAVQDVQRARLEEERVGGAVGPPAGFHWGRRGEGGAGEGGGGHRRIAM